MISAVHINPDPEATKLIQEYLKENGIELYNELFDDNYIYAHSGVVGKSEEIAIIGVNGSQLNMKCRSFDLHNPNSLPELLQTLRKCLKRECKTCRGASKIGLSG
jgi:hypothetical protein